MAPPLMRGMMMSYARQGIAVAFTGAFSAFILFNLGYVWPRHERYEQFFKNYDPYTRMREICAENKGYLHTCPDELAKKFEQKGKPVASQ